MEVYCDMEGSNCGGEGGWMRVADIDMTIPGTNCPEGLYMYDLELPHPLCSYLNTSALYQIIGLHKSIFGAVLQLYALENTMRIKQ